MKTLFDLTIEQLKEIAKVSGTTIKVDSIRKNEDSTYDNEWVIDFTDGDQFIMIIHKDGDIHLAAGFGDNFHNCDDSLTINATAVITQLKEFGIQC